MHLHFFVDWTGGDVIANGSIIVRLNHICFYKCLILAQNMEDIKDPIIQKVVEQFISRSNVGFKKYKITLDEDSKTTYEWLQNIQEELMDAVNYIEKLKSVIKIKR